MASVSISRTSPTTSASVVDDQLEALLDELVVDLRDLVVEGQQALAAGALGEADEQLGALVEVGNGSADRLLVQLRDRLHPLEAVRGHDRADRAAHDDHERGHVEEGRDLAAFHGRAEGEPDERDDDSDCGGGLHD